MVKVKGLHSDEIFEILPRKKIEKIIENLEPEKVVEVAYAGYIPGKKTGYAAIDLVTGDLKTKSLGHGESDTGRDSLWISVYSIPQEAELLITDLYTFKEIEEYKNSEMCKKGYSIEEYFNLSEEELAKRKKEALLLYFAWDDAKEWQLIKWYGEG